MNVIVSDIEKFGKDGYLLTAWGNELFSASVVNGIHLPLKFDTPLEAYEHLRDEVLPALIVASNSTEESAVLLKSLRNTKRPRQTNIDCFFDQCKRKDLDCGYQVVPIQVIDIASKSIGMLTILLGNLMDELAKLKIENPVLSKYTSPNEYSEIHMSNLDRTIRVNGSGNAEHLRLVTLILSILQEVPYVYK